MEELLSIHQGNKLIKGTNNQTSQNKLQQDEVSAQTTALIFKVALDTASGGVAGNWISRDSTAEAVTVPFLEREPGKVDAILTHGCATKLSEVNAWKYHHNSEFSNT